MVERGKGNERVIHPFHNGEVEAKAKYAANDVLEAACERCHYHPVSESQRGGEGARDKEDCTTASACIISYSSPAANRPPPSPFLLLPQQHSHSPSLPPPQPSSCPLARRRQPHRLSHQPALHPRRGLEERADAEADEVKGQVGVESEWREEGEKARQARARAVGSEGAMEGAGDADDEELEVATAAAAPSLQAMR
ncbi:hypothetical protein B0H19DRAFT_1257905 [Mycena capillaripes]|nr:hypothetical protein B0H19DRAFT_1257905 [Mycena capillaripes]